MSLAHASDAEPILLRDDRDGIATLTLNRPAQRNALSRDLMAALQTELEAIRTDRSVKVVILAANGPAFCAGHDLKEVRAHSDEPFFKALFEQCSELMLTITRIPQIVIARVHALATAAGCQLVASCDLAVAADSAKFATPGVNIGLFCSTPMVAISRNISRKKMMEMLVTGEAIDAATAETLGLLNRVVPLDQLDTAVGELAAKIVSKSPLTLAIGKEAFYAQVEQPMADAYAYASAVMTRNMMARDAQEGIDAFIAKRAPVWTGN
ncbi:enoyl-CoA hydratase [Thalassobaculum sp.]|uniref:enoyl-CoA hydratase n=1 Tax=Thalassobaculum sp. TaxID=2022740 RepID=UPI0032EA93EB